MTPDPRWLEILKAGGWQFAALATACGLYLLVSSAGWIPRLDAWAVQLAVFGLLIFGLLAVASLLSAAWRFFNIPAFAALAVRNRHECRWLRDYIPTMTIEERNIIAYLLAKNQRTFMADSDGGYAAPLISHRIVVRAVQAGQIVAADSVPFTVPEHIWKTLQKIKSEFPYASAPDEDEVEIHPWRKPWGL